MHYSSDSDGDCEPFSQVEQIPFGKGRFNGRIYLPDSSDDHCDDLSPEKESQPPAVRSKTPVSIQRKSPYFVESKSQDKSKGMQKRKRSASSLLQSARKSIHPPLPTVSTDIDTENTPPDCRKDAGDSRPKSMYAIDRSTDAVLKQIQKTNDLLSVVAQRLNNTEKRLDKVEDEVSNAGSSLSSDNSTSTAKKRVPLPVSVSACMHAYIKQE